MDNKQIIDALIAALKHTPKATDLQIHLTDLLLEEKDFELALSYIQSWLNSEPLNPINLQRALICAKELNNSPLITAYESMLKVAMEKENSQDISTKNLVPGDEKSSYSENQHVKKNNNITQLNPAPSQSGNRKKRQRVRTDYLQVVDENFEASIIDDENIYLDDVGGMDEVKRRLFLSFLGPLQNPELVKAYGKSLGGGLLLYGPPGCGKTYIARALAGELGAKFIPVGLADILDMYVGESERKLHEVFEKARRMSPTVLFFDELDAIGQRRSQLKNSGMRSLVNLLLSEMDSVHSNNNYLFILGATNHPWDVDPALCRPGRFDRMVTVFPPDLEARKEIIKKHLENKPIENVDIEKIATQTENFSGADLKYLCESTIEYALEESIQTGQIKKLQTGNFISTLSKQNPSTIAWFETARNFAIFSNEGGKYDDLLNYIRQHQL